MNVFISNYYYFFFQNNDEKLRIFNVKEECFIYIHKYMNIKICFITSIIKRSLTSINSELIITNMRWLKNKIYAIQIYSS